MTFTTLRYEKIDRVAIATFATPDNLNGITEARLDELEAVLTDCETDETIGALILTGEGRAFCVGLDLDLLDRAFADLDYFDIIVARVNGIITRLENLDIPTIAANNGFTRAGGFEISLGCDFMIVADEAKVGDVHTDAGVVPAAVTLRLKRRVGDQRAKEILWTARWYKGQEAVDVGLAMKSVPLATLRDEAIAFARTMTDKPRATLATLKQIMRDGERLSTADGAALELAAFAHYNRTQPYGREGYSAFREKRVPSWKAA
ncbi:enoyl-CoA hydratase/isomerase family protein [Sphingomonas sp. SUN019]|uniref:enoyl-CoA hydratase/isomerase family protein n=1 Tax=Sphingomonas sp. SUN019 TaxID=2937788 RepID=UPI002164B07A|nr:enoyl-CoA hydratase/isomerase family protein [Sphingomonas sp. SUN019]UVO50717.1 enoyl-CoA hydratase/isomerase family protein [Sphingomonas sp. SUN019]